MFQDHQVAYLLEHVKIREAQRLSLLRQAVACILSRSAAKVPHAAMNTTYDVTPLITYTSEKEAGLKHGTGPMDDKALFRRAIHKNFSAFFLKAIAHSLHHTPCMNAFLDYSPWLKAGTLYRAEDVNLGFTVHTKYGVVRPVVRNPHLKTLEQVATEMRDLTRRARRTDPEELYRRAVREYLRPALRQLDWRAILPGLLLIRANLFDPWKPSPEYRAIPESSKLRVEDILGATCGVANIGMMVPGHQTVTVIPPPEVMMFGIGDLHLAPWVVNGEVVPRHVIVVTGSMDHRAFDAGEAFPFRHRLAHYINHPELLYGWQPGDPV